MPEAYTGYPPPGDTMKKRIGGTDGAVICRCGRRYTVQSELLHDASTKAITCNVRIDHDDVDECAGCKCGPDGQKCGHRGTCKRSPALADYYEPVQKVTP